MRERTFWNGPVGVFELDQFGQATQAITRAIASSQSFSLAEGGDTLAAIEKYSAEKSISYISTGAAGFWNSWRERPCLRLQSSRSAQRTVRFEAETLATALGTIVSEPIQRPFIARKASLLGKLPTQAADSSGV